MANLSISPAVLIQSFGWLMNHFGISVMFNAKNFLNASSLLHFSVAFFADKLLRVLLIKIHHHHHERTNEKREN
jgi:hypothetical protein